MKNIVKSIFFLGLLSVVITSCSKRPDPEPGNGNGNGGSGNGEIGIEVSNYAGVEELTLGNTYTSASGPLTINKFNYYISNIRLKKSDGTEFAETESYHLVLADKKSSGHFHISVPPGSYTGMSFLIGVDSARNVDGAQTGALDPVNAMFWTWSTGYIMAKLEGKSASSGASDSAITYHIGGFKGPNSALRTVTLNFAQTKTVTSGGETTIKVKADALKWFTPNNIDFATEHEIMSVNATSKKIADNYANMFSIIP